MLLAHWHTKAITLRSIVIIKTFSFIACLRSDSPPFRLQLQDLLVQLLLEVDRWSGPHPSLRPEITE